MIRQQLLKSGKTLKKITKKSLNTQQAKQFSWNEGAPLVMSVNRGEIASRVFRAAKEQKMNSIAVFSEVDSNSLHRFKADKSVQLDSSKSPVQQYLDIDYIVDLAKKEGVNIIHPGYGFLSENPELSEKVEKAGITFAGPKADVISFFGDKIRSKEFAKQQGVPVPEGTPTAVSLDEAKEFAKKISYPVMVKATSGGGGRGIRIARDEAELIESYERCHSEALTAFGNGDIFIEKFVEEPRHIEVQIIADETGDVVHLFERDCSVQRRNQKVVEIAPSANLPAATREQMLKDAVTLAKAAKYRSAGTIEFLVDKSGKHFFLECNTRIQVEHTVSEEVTGIDIVGTQLQIARGKTLKELGLTQDKIQCRGVSIQVRVTTEDASEGFSPAIGRIQSYQPGGSIGIRVDGNAYTGSEITPSYDSLLCKVIATAPTFKEASSRLLREINETEIHGLTTNQNFLKNVLQHEDFLKGNFTTKFIEEHPELFNFKPYIDEQTAMLNWFGDFVVNRTPKLQGASFLTTAKSPLPPVIPAEEKIKKEDLRGFKDILNKEGPEGLAKAALNSKKLLLTDTTMRDAHQSLLMTRMRTRDILQASETTAQTHRDFFSLENWGGATFDVSMRFLHECPWERLEQMREIIPNIPFQMLLRGANAVGYTSYADNVVHAFCQQAVKSGMDIFRVFDSLNYMENMKLGIDAVGQAGGVVEGTVCYTGIRDKYTLEYYVEYARQLIDYGIHILALKDMTGLLKPYEATLLISTLKKEFPNTPIHVHMHDNAGASIASLKAAAEAGADIIDLCTDAMSGVTSQGSFGTMLNILKNSPIDPKIDLKNDYGLNQYWKQVRNVYAPFEAPERSCFSDVYEHEMPGGQYTNLQFQAQSMGLGNQWDKVKQCYIEANQALGDIIKVTPSSKIVGDLANFMVTNNLTLKDVREQAKTLDFPKSTLEYLQGYIGQPYGGFPEPFRTDVLNAAGLKPLEGRPGDSIPAFDFEKRMAELKAKHGKHIEITHKDVISSSQYEQVFDDLCEIRKQYGYLDKLPTEYLLRPIEYGETIKTTLRDGSPMELQLIGEGKTNVESGKKEVIFRVNGTLRTVLVQDKSVQKTKKDNEKVSAGNDKQVGSPVKSQLIDVKVAVGDEVAEGQVVAIVSAMKMEMTVKAPSAGKVSRVLHGKGAELDSGDLILELN